MKHIIAFIVTLLAGSAIGQTWAEAYTYNVGTTAKMVRFGAGDQWVAKPLTGSVLCRQSTFGVDPAVGKVKSCAVMTECLPSQIGGTGGKAVAASNDKGMYAAWWCKGEPIPLVFACTTANCPLAKTKSAVASVLTGTSPGAASASAQTATVYSASLRAVWEPDWPKILAVKP